MVAYPTETFFGLGVDITNPKALRTLFELKGREANKPFPVLLSNKPYLATLCPSIPSGASKLIDAYWPGPLTIVLSAPGLSPLLQNKNGGVGFRVSAHPQARALVQAFGGAITTTSANLAGCPPAATSQDIRQTFPDGDVLILPEVSAPQGHKPSTVIEFFHSHDWVIHREGSIPSQAISAMLT